MIGHLGGRQRIDLNSRQHTNLVGCQAATAAVDSERIEAVFSPTMSVVSMAAA